VQINDFSLPFLKLSSASILPAPRRGATTEVVYFGDPSPLISQGSKRWKSLLLGCGEALEGLAGALHQLSPALLDAGTQITLTAPQLVAQHRDHFLFRQWTLNGSPQPVAGTEVTFTLSQAGMARRWWKVGHMTPGQEIKERGSTLRYEPAGS
jgi:hypothetical protein